MYSLMYSYTPIHGLYIKFDVSPGLWRRAELLAGPLLLGGRVVRLRYSCIEQETSFLARVDMVDSGEMCGCHLSPAGAVAVHGQTNPGGTSVVFSFEELN